jgi:hypothetical protein
MSEAKDIAFCCMRDRMIRVVALLGLFFDDEVSILSDERKRPDPVVSPKVEPLENDTVSRIPRMPAGVSPLKSSTRKVETRQCDPWPVWGVLIPQNSDCAR